VSKSDVLNGMPIPICPVIPHLLRVPPLDPPYLNDPSMGPLFDGRLRLGYVDADPLSLFSFFIVSGQFISREDIS